MSNPECDADAWNKYKQHRWLFNKLELSLRLGYKAGPAGTSVDSMGDYIVRPIYNLSGMGVGATREFLKPDDYHTVKPGEFWCEYFYGPNISIDYEWEDIAGEQILRPVFAVMGIRTSLELYRFNAWKKIVPPMHKLPKWINQLTDVPRFNIEFINDKIIEIHLRPGNDFPAGASEIIPVWDDMTQQDCNFFLMRGFKEISNQDDADGHLPIARRGFLYR